MSEDETFELRIDLATIEAVGDEAPPPIPDPTANRVADGTGGRLARLTAAGRAMREGIREEIRTASESMFGAAVEQARVRMENEVRRFESDVRHELEVMQEDLRKRTSEGAWASLNLEARLNELTAMLSETREAVLRLQARYVPSAKRE